MHLNGVETKKALNTGYWTGYCLKVSTGVCKGGSEPADMWGVGPVNVVQQLEGEENRKLYFMAVSQNSACYYFGLK